MLMDIPERERAEFLLKVTAGSRPAYRVTHAGDPVRQARLLVELPVVYAVTMREERMRDAY